MDWKIFLITMRTISLAEVEDKTQLLAILMTSKTGRPIPFFIGAIAAFTWETFISVVKGERGSPCFYLNRGFDVLWQTITFRSTWNLVLGHGPC